MASVVKIVTRCNRIMLGVKNYSTRAVSLTYSQYGEPVKVIEPLEHELESPGSGQVLLKMLAAPVNPADINTIQGTYPEKPPLPAVGGKEGVGEIIQIGPDVKNLSPGDRVVHLTTEPGTWRTHGIFGENELYKVPKELGLAEAATFTVNPCTAYRMIKDFKTLNPGETVIQNGANSACGQIAIQLCKAWGINSVNIVRNRPDIDELKAYLKGLGATYVLTEEEIRSTDIFKKGTIKKPTLALNCVGGKSALEILRHLNMRGAMVTYGGMSRDPVTVPTSAFIFKDIALYGYWMTRWSKENAGCERRNRMFDEIIKMMMDGSVKAPAFELVKFDDYKKALMNTLAIQGFTGKKYILDFA